MGTNCAPLVADLFLFCYERDFMTSLSDDNQADITEAFNSTSRYLDDLLNIDNLFYHSCTTYNAFILTDSIQIKFLCVCSVHKQIYKKMLFFCFFVVVF